MALPGAGKMGMSGAWRALLYAFLGGTAGLVLVWLAFALTFLQVDFDVISWLMLGGAAVGAAAGFARHYMTRRPG
jgi:hypothetical protein